MKRIWKYLMLCTVVMIFAFGLQERKISFASGYINAVKQTAVSQSSVTVSWKYNDYANSTVAIYRYEIEGGSVPITGEAYEESAVIEGLKAGNLYTVQISAYDANGELLAQSSKAEVRTLPGKLKKKNFGLTNAYGSIDTYYFGTKEKKSQISYEWQFADAAGKVKKTQSTSSYSDLRVENFINGKFYQYRVRPFMTIDGKNYYSNWSDYNYIGVVKEGKYKSTKSSIQITWGALKDAKKFIVYASKKKDSGYKKVKTVSASKRKMTLTKLGGKKLKKGTAYYFRIIAVAKVGKKMVKADSPMYYSVYTRSF